MDYAISGYVVPVESKGNPAGEYVCQLFHRTPEGAIWTSGLVFGRTHTEALTAACERSLTNQP